MAAVRSASSSAQRDRARYALARSWNVRCSSAGSGLEPGTVSSRRASVKSDRAPAVSPRPKRTTPRVLYRAAVSSTGCRVRCHSPIESVSSLSACFDRPDCAAENARRSVAWLSALGPLSSVTSIAGHRLGDAKVSATASATWCTARATDSAPASRGIRVGRMLPRDLCVAFSHNKSTEARPDPARYHIQ
eukprot:scaffold32450_cov107-Isochrysis_galbana.AAC.1